MYVHVGVHTEVSFRCCSSHFVFWDKVSHYYLELLPVSVFPVPQLQACVNTQILKLLRLMLEIEFWFGGKYFITENPNTANLLPPEIFSSGSPNLNPSQVKSIKGWTVSQPSWSLSQAGKGQHRSLRTQSRKALAWKSLGFQSSITEQGGPGIWKTTGLPKPYYRL